MLFITNLFWSDKRVKQVFTDADIGDDISLKNLKRKININNICNLIKLVI
jgi:hypothetical protein